MAPSPREVSSSPRAGTLHPNPAALLAYARKLIDKGQDKEVKARAWTR